MSKTRGVSLWTSFRKLQRNTKVAVLCYPLWAIPFVLYSFYLGLYMKAQGATDRELGFVVGIGFIFAALAMVYGGAVADRLGRKRTVFLVDLLATPVFLLVWMIADKFWLFTLATAFNSLAWIGGIAYTCLLTEDVSAEERVVAFNINNITLLGSGLLIPLAGLLVNRVGVVMAERYFLGMAVVFSICLAAVRNRFLMETVTGRKVMEESRQGGWRVIPAFHPEMLSFVIGNARILTAIGLNIGFNVFYILGSFNSMYYVPYLTEVIGLEPFQVSVLGGVISGTTLGVFAFIVPLLVRYDSRWNLLWGFLLQAMALMFFLFVTRGGFGIALISAAIYGLGMGMMRPFLDAMLGNAVEGEKRASAYAVNNLFVCIANTLTGFLAGFLYGWAPVGLYVGSLIILGLIIWLLARAFGGNRFWSGREVAKN